MFFAYSLFSPLTFIKTGAPYRDKLLCCFHFDYLLNILCLYEFLRFVKIFRVSRKTFYSHRKSLKLILALARHCLQEFVNKDVKTFKTFRTSFKAVV